MEDMARLGAELAFSDDEVTVGGPSVAFLVVWASHGVGLRGTYPSPRPSLTPTANPLFQMLCIPLPAAHIPVH